MTLVETYSGSVDPGLDVVWIKDVARPFLNRTVTVVDFTGVARSSRGAVVQVAGRRLPIAITEVAGSREYQLTLRASTVAELAALDLFLSFGDTVYVQVPTDCALPSTGHWFVGSVGTARVGKHDGTVRYVTLDLVEVDAPDDSIVGSTVTYLGVSVAWATYGDLLADPDVPTYLDLVEYVSSPSDEIVG